MDRCPLWIDVPMDRCLMDTCPLTLVSLFAPGMEQSWRHTCLLINAPLCRRAAWQVTVRNPTQAEDWEFWAATMEISKQWL